MPVNSVHDQLGRRRTRPMTNSDHYTSTKYAPRTGNILPVGGTLSACTPGKGEPCCLTGYRRGLVYLPSTLTGILLVTQFRSYRTAQKQLPKHPNPRFGHTRELTSGSVAGCWVIHCHYVACLIAPAQPSVSSPGFAGRAIPLLLAA
ncbi:hypothetical protein E2C01_047650 [Portunus trituberculatus]|uniref:Uncharacterized protein n=1 Tax=Portunus trituberculatus TaxID=210409 RepID=A0A5B7G1P3_PORTR|nr:hypothetical protein [Portunus trituberculatus]